MSRLKSYIPGWGTLADMLLLSGMVGWFTYNVRDWLNSPPGGYFTIALFGTAILFRTYNMGYRAALHGSRIALDAQARLIEAQHGMMKAQAAELAQGLDLQVQVIEPRPGQPRVVTIRRFICLN